MTVDRQLEILKRGVVDLVDEAALRRRLEDAAKSGTKLRVKLGLDPTGYDLHLGHTVVLRKLRAFQDLGHQAVLIIGDATAMVGDPSGRDKTRPILTREQVDEYAQSWMDQVDGILDVSALEVRKNSEFFRDMHFPDVLRLMGRMTVAQMLERNDFSTRHKAGNPISLHEFLYPIMQGWDSVCVQADVELGGTDQLFNLHVGRQFQEQEGQRPQILMTTEIVEGTDGSLKMSKSYQNAIGINEAPNEMFGKLMSIPDALMRKYFVHFTDLPEPEIDEILAGHPRDAKMRLGREILTIRHSADAAEAGQAHFVEIFQRGNQPDEMPTVEIPAADAPGGAISPIDLVKRAGFAKSGGEARRLIQQGAVSIDGEKVTDVDQAVAIADGQVLKVGKRRFARIQLIA